MVYISIYKLSQYEFLNSFKNVLYIQFIICHKQLKCTDTQLNNNYSSSTHSYDIVYLQICFRETELSRILQLPDELLVSILKLLELQDLLQNVGKCCKKLKHIIENSSVLWRHVSFDTPLHFNEDQLCRLLTHSMKFQEFHIPCARINSYLADIDYCFVQLLPNAKTDCKVSTLCFLKKTT